MAEQNELPVVADVFTMQALVPGERAVHYSRLLVEVPRGTKLTDHAAATARIAALEAKLESERNDRGELQAMFADKCAEVFALEAKIKEQA